MLRSSRFSARLPMKSAASPPDSPRALPAEDLAAFLRSSGWKASAYSSVAEGISAAVDRAKETGGMVCAAGSLYLAGPIRELFGCY